MEKFEYFTMVHPTKGWLGGNVEVQTFQSDLNKLGAQGWELVNSFSTNQDLGSSKNIVSIFKRKITQL